MGLGIGDRGEGVLLRHRQQHRLRDGRLGARGAPHHEGADRGEGVLVGDRGQGDAPGAPVIGGVGVAELVGGERHREGRGLPGGELVDLGRRRQGGGGGVGGGVGLPAGEGRAIGDPRGQGAQLEGERRQRLRGGVRHLDPGRQRAPLLQRGGSEGDKIHAHSGVRGRLRRQRGGVDGVRGTCGLRGGQYRQPRSDQHRCSHEQCRQECAEHRVHGGTGRRHGDTVSGRYRRGAVGARHPHIAWPALRYPRQDPP